MKKNATIFDKISEGQKHAIFELISEVDTDDFENSIRNAKRCLEGQGYLELQNMVSNYFYRAGANKLRNEIREILNLEPIYTEQEKERLDAMLKQREMGSKVWWNCPELQEHEYALKIGRAGLIPLGEDGSLIVVGTLSSDKASRMMRQYLRDIGEDDVLPTAGEVQSVKLVWRKADGEGEGDYTHMFNWSEKETKNNPSAVNAIIYNG